MWRSKTTWFEDVPNERQEKDVSTLSGATLGHGSTISCDHLRNTAVLGIAAVD